MFIALILVATQLDVVVASSTIELYVDSNEHSTDYIHMVIQQLLWLKMCSNISLGIAYAYELWFIRRITMMFVINESLKQLRQI